MESSNQYMSLQRLYGRDKEKRELEDAFNQVRTRRGKLMFVNGFAGSGKTILINRTFKDIVSEKEYFISGKADQLQHSEPYAPFIEAFGSLIRQILTESEENFNIWRKNLYKALGMNGAVITNMIEELELIIGPQRNVKILQPREAENRFKIVVHNFIRAIAAKEHPVIIFLDDLQWADPATLQLIELLAQDLDNCHMLLIGAFRDSEVNASHPLSKLIERLQRTDSKVKSITLQPLDLRNVGRLIDDTCRHTLEDSKPLAEILYMKTGGNPFFLTQLLEMIYHEGYLSVHLEAGNEGCVLERLSKLEIAEDVLELMIYRLKKLPIETLNILKLAACIGNKFDIDILSIICEKPQQIIVERLNPAIQSGIVLLIEEKTERKAQDSKEKAIHPIFKKTYEFMHDRVQQAAYSFVPEAEKKPTHLKIGRLILKNTFSCDSEQELFNIVDHLNCGLDLIVDKQEQISLAGYNLMAGRRAKAATAYTSAVTYLKTGMILLPANPWVEQYRLTYDIYLELSQCLYLCTHFDEAERLFDILIKNSEDDMQKTEIYGLKMVLHSGMGNYSQAISYGMKALKCLKADLPHKPGKCDLIKEFMMACLYKRGRKVESLYDMSAMSDPVCRKVLELIILLAPSTNIINPELFILINLKAGSLSMRYGNTDFSSIAYAGYSLFWGSVLGRYGKGYLFERLAIKLSEKYNDNYARCIVYFTIGAFVSHWTQHARISAKYLEKSSHYGMECGELLFSGYADSIFVQIQFYTGVSLEEIYRICKNKFGFAKRINHETLIDNLVINRQLISQLMGDAEDSFPEGNAESQNEFIEKLIKENKKPILLYHYFSKAFLSYLYGEYEMAMGIIEEAQKDMNSGIGYMLSAEYNFLYSLVITAVHCGPTGSDKRIYLKILNKNQKQLRKWSHYCPENFLHKYLLVNAEKASLLQGNQKAAFLYDQAIESARDNGFIQNEAIACELACKYHLKNGRGKIAKAYMIDAFRGYIRWGAAKKAIDLKQRYPELLTDSFITETREVISIRPVNMDINMKAMADFNNEVLNTISQYTSKEADSKKIIGRFLDITIEYLNFDRGFVFIEENGSFYLAAAREKGNGICKGGMDQSGILEKAVYLPRTVVRYSVRTQEPVVLNEQEHTGIFEKDPYIRKYSPKTIVCLPLLFQGVLMGALYLEDTLQASMLSAERLEMVKALSHHLVYAIKLITLQESSIYETNGSTKDSLIIPLTDREYEVLTLIAEGMSNKEVAVKLELTISTVKTHIGNIYGKLQVNKRVQAVSRAKELGILQ